MKKYIKNFFLHYCLLYVVLSFIGFFILIYNITTISIYLIIFTICLALYNLFLKHINSLNLSLLKMNTIIFYIAFFSFGICLVSSQLHLSSPIWNIFSFVSFPFSFLSLCFHMMGLQIELMICILATLFTNLIIEYICLKPQIEYKKIITAIFSTLCVTAFFYLYYQNSPNQKYKGHGFDYMNGYSTTDLSAYTPYAKNSKLVLLPQESSLIIDKEEDMPILDGAEACYPVYSAIAKAVYKDIDQIELNYKNQIDYDDTNGKIVSFTNSSEGYSRLINSEIDMFFGAKPSESQLKEAQNAGVEFEYMPIGKEAFVFFVNQKNPVNGLTTQQIKDIYHGSISNWQEVGGKNVNIIAFQRPERSGSQTMMNHFMENTSLKEPLTYEMQIGMGTIIQEVAEYYNEDGAIGYTFKYFLEGLNQEENVKILSIDSIYPTAENIKNQTYPLSTYLYCVTLKSNDKENVKKLKEFLLSEQGQYIIEKTGYYGLH